MLLELKTNLGFAYLQFVLKHETLSEMLRVLPGAYAEAPGADDLCALAKLRERYLVFCPVGLYLRRKDPRIRLAASCGVPSDFATMPPLRSSGARDASGRVLWWQIDDRNESRRVTTLSPSEATYSIEQVSNLEGVIGRIETNWSPALDIGVPSVVGAIPNPSAHETETVTHYLYFKNGRDAGHVVGRLSQVDGLSVQNQQRDPNSWVALVRHDVREISIDAVADLASRAAEENAGEYDGYEMRAQPSE